jgi:hypothetical protein
MTRHPTRGILPLLAAASMLLAACSDDTDGAARTQPHATSSSDAVAGTPDAGPPWKPLAAQLDNVPLAAGTYGLTANGVSDHVAVIRAPEGYRKLGGWTFVAGEPFRGLGFVTADRVPPDPCGSEGRRSKFDRAVDPGPSVEELTRALVAQKGAVTSRPVPVTLDGHPGRYLTYRVAKGVDVSKCEAGAFDIFSTGPGSWWLEASRERAAIWILDVDGERLVLAWVAVPGVTRAHLREMTRMVESAGFVEP